MGFCGSKEDKKENFCYGKIKAKFLCTSVVKVSIRSGFIEIYALEVKYVI